VRKPTQAFKSVKDLGNIFNLNPKWQELCRPWYIFHEIFIETPPPSTKQNSNIKVDIWHPTVGLRCRNPTRHLSPLKAQEIHLIDWWRQSSWPHVVYVKGIARAFNWLKCLGGFLHRKPTVGCQISTLIFDFFLWRGSLYKYSMKNILRTTKFLTNQSKVFPGPLTDLSAWVGFCTSSTQQGVKYQLWYLKTNCGGGSLSISHKNMSRTAKFLPNFS
jgi:hypothetical protein